MKIADLIEILQQEWDQIPVRMVVEDILLEVSSIYKYDGELRIELHQEPATKRLQSKISQLQSALRDIQSTLDEAFWHADNL